MMDEFGFSSLEEGAWRCACDMVFRNGCSLVLKKIRSRGSQAKMCSLLCSLNPNRSTT